MNKIDSVVFEMRQARAALIDSDRRFETLATQAPVGIFMTDATGNCTYVNPRCCEILGMRPEDAMGQGWANALHPEDRDRILSQLRDAQRTGGVFESEHRFLWPNGKSVWVAAKSVAIRDDGGKPTGRIGIVTDITDRRAAELSEKEANQRMKTVLDASPLAILSIDARGRIMAWNRGAERMFGWSESEAVGRVCPTVPDEGLDDFHGMTRSVLAGEPWTGKVRDRRKKSGEVIRASISAAPILDAQGEKIGIVAILEDVTERERTQERLRSLLEERERVAQDLHDGCIQTVYAIGLNLEECRALVRDHPRKAAQKIAGAAADLNLVIHDLRLFILGDKREIASGDDLKAALEKTVQMMGDRPPAFAVEIDAAAATSLTPDQAMHLLQIARAALGNAARHANARSGLLSLQMRDGAISLEVSDDGVGFDAEEIEQPGLGLHNIEARARKLGGRLRVISAPDQGTRVVVEIPRAR